jgi:hypothetical protein
MWPTADKATVTALFDINGTSRKFASGTQADLFIVRPEAPKKANRTNKRQGKLSYHFPNVYDVLLTGQYHPTASFHCITNSAPRAAHLNLRIWTSGKNWSNAY